MLLALVTPSLNVAHSDPSDISTACRDSNELAVYRPDAEADREWACAAASRSQVEVAQARVYLAETASPGYTMTLQGPEVAIGCLHPEFAVRLAHAIREARSGGLPFAAIFSAYRPPAFGVGGFRDKFNSLHTYGLAVDMRGIGMPGSPEAELWHEIAARNGVVCPYGPHDHAEWNHCQPTSIKIISAGNPLRETVSATGPLDLETMFEIGDSMIEDMASAADSLARARPTPVRILETAAKRLNPAAPLPVTRAMRRNSPVAVPRRVAAKSVAHHAKLGQHAGASAPRQRHT